MAVNLRAEISRKVLHVTSALIPLVYLFTPQFVMLALVLLCLIIAVVVEQARLANAGFAAFFRRFLGFMLRDREERNTTGATYVFVGAALTIALFPKWIAIAGLLILSLADTAASLIGIRYGRARFLGKSLAGSSAFFVTALAILWVIFPAAPRMSVIAALAAALIEAAPSVRVGPFELNDNVTIPVGTGVVLLLLGF